MQEPQVTGAQAPVSTSNPMIADRVMELHISKKLLQREPELYASKWFDYRFLSPYEATEKFITLFGQIAKRIYARDIDYKAAENMRVPTMTGLVVDLDNMEPTRKTKGRARETTRSQVAKTTLTGFWRARMVADAIGMPYDHFIEQALNGRLKAWKRTYLPMPSQLYDGKAMARVLHWWKEAQEDVFFYSDLPAYEPQNYIGAPAQVEHNKWVVEQALKRGGAAPAMLAGLVDEGIISWENMSALVPGEILENVEDHLL